jgi:hypothetical protein
VSCSYSTLDHLLPVYFERYGEIGASGNGIVPSMRPLTSDDRESAVGSVADVVFVDQGVVVPAREDAVVVGGGSAVGPVPDVVDVAVLRWGVAVDVPAGPVP